MQVDDELLLSGLFGSSDEVGGNGLELDTRCTWSRGEKGCDGKDGDVRVVSIEVVATDRVSRRVDNCRRIPTNMMCSTQGLPLMHKT